MLSSSYRKEKGSSIHSQYLKEGSRNSLCTTLQGLFAPTFGAAFLSARVGWYGKGVAGFGFTEHTPAPLCLSSSQEVLCTSSNSHLCHPAHQEDRISAELLHALDAPEHWCSWTAPVFPNNRPQHLPLQPLSSADPTDPTLQPFQPSPFHSALTSTLGAA